MLEIDGTAIGQSITILRYVAGIAGLWPADEIDKLRCDSILEEIQVGMMRDFPLCPRRVYPPSLVLAHL